jgi:hypothetical protein
MLFARDFNGMTTKLVCIEELTAARGANHEHRRQDTGRAQAILDLIRALRAGLEMRGLPAVAEFPAVKWRQQNLDPRTKDQRAVLVANLEKVLTEKGQ